MVANDWVSPEDIRDTEGMLTDSNARLIRTAEQAKVRSLFAERADMKGDSQLQGMPRVSRIYVGYKPAIRAEEAPYLTSLREYDCRVTAPDHVKRSLPLGTLAARVIAGVSTPECANVDTN